MKVETLFRDAGGGLVNPNFERVADAPYVRILTSGIIDIMMRQ